MTIRRMFASVAVGAGVVAGSFGGLHRAAAQGGAPASFDEITRSVGVQNAALIVLAGPADLGVAWTPTVVLGGEQVVLDVQPRSVRAAGYQAFAVDENGSRRVIDAPAPATFAGTIAGRSNTIVGLAVVEAGIRGVIDDGVTRWYIQPVADSMGGAPAGLHAIYRGEDLREAPEATCGGAILPDVAVSTARGTPAVTCQREVQIAFEADVPYFRANGSSESATIADIESVVASMNVIYQRDGAVAIVIPSTLIRTVPADPMGQPDSAFEPYTSTSSGALLGQFRVEWTNNQSGVARDLAHLMTGRDLDGSTIGVAYLNVVCSQTFGFGLSQSRFTTNFSRRVALTSHEVGHNFSASHCDGDSDCAIMCSGLGGCTGVVTRFGTRGVNSIRSAATLSCLTNVAPPATPIDPRAVNDSAAVAAGASINIDVLSNDFSGACLPVTIASFPASLSSGATVVRQVGSGPNGRDVLRYSAPAGFAGVDTFTYTISDGTRTGSAVVRVTSTTPRVPENPARTLPGLDVSYYRVNSAGSVPDFTALTPVSTGASLATINFTGSGNLLDSGRSVVAARFRASLSVPESGVYTFYTTSDDGSMLFIDGRLVVSNDYSHGDQERSGSITLNAGTHDLDLGYFQNGGPFSLRLEWAGPSLARAVIPAANLPGGAAVQFFLMPANTSVLPAWGGLTPFATDVATDINWPSSNGPFATSGREDYVGAVYTGFVSVVNPGVYNFYTESDDGSRLLIGSTQVVSNDGLHGMQERSGSLNLATGVHAMRVEFFEAGSGAGLIARWDGPGVSKRVIEPGSLRRLDPACGLSDVAGPGQAIGPDGELTADDIIVFLNWFFASDPRGNVAGAGQTTTPDNELTADDIIVFLNRFFAGC